MPSLPGIMDFATIKMAFDNNGFEQKVGNTLSSIAKLKESLKFSGVGKGLENISTRVKDIGMDSLYESVYKTQDSFNALEVVATRVLQRITDKVLDTGSKLVKAVTIDPIKSGLSEYETQINSVQTILANTGDALKEQGLETEHDRIEKINGVLDDLNSYADMTIYNFTEMTRNIGTFTAAGVELDTAATSIKGIANLAAMSGSNSQQASTAMYQLSQAIAAGSVKLQDWNSVVNAGMGGKLFQNELIDTAKAMGVADEQFQKLVDGSMTFRESLSSGWISSEVLTNTLEKFTAGSEGYTKSQVQQMQQLWKARGYSDQQIQELTGSIKQLDETQEENLRTKWAEKGFSPEQIDHILSMGTAATEAATKVKTFNQLLDTVKEALQSGWTQSWEYIIGDFEQAKMLWTEISDILNLYIGKSADARNEVLKGWSAAAYSYNEDGKLIENASGKIVDSMDMSKLGGREAIIQGFRNSFQSLFEVMIKADEAFHKGFLGDAKEDNLVSNIAITDKKLIKLSHDFLNFTIGMKKALTNKDGSPTKFLKDLGIRFTDLARALRKGYDGIAGLFSGLGTILSSAFSSIFKLRNLTDIISILDSVTSHFSAFGDAFRKQFSGKIDGNAKGLTSFFTGLIDVLKELFSIKIDFLVSAFDGLGQVFNHIIPSGETLSTMLGKVGDKLSDFSKFLYDLTHDNKGISIFEGIFSNLATDFNNFFDVLSKNVDYSGLNTFFLQLTKNIPNLDISGMLENIGQILLNVIEGILGVLGPLTSAFSTVFGSSLLDAATFVINLVDKLRSLSDVLQLNESQMTGLTSVFTGIFKIVKAIGVFIANTFNAAWDGLATIFAELLPSANNVGDFLKNIGDDLNSFGDHLLNLASGKEEVKSLADIIEIFAEKIAGFIRVIKDSGIIAGFGDILKNLFNTLKAGLFGTSDISFLDGIVEKVKEFMHGIVDAFSTDSGVDMGKVIGTVGILTHLKQILDFFKDFKKGFSEVHSLSKIASILSDFTDVLGSIADRLKLDSLKTIAIALLELSFALLILSSIDVGKLAKATGAVAAILKTMEQMLTTVSKFEQSSIPKFTAAAIAIQTLGVAMLLFAASIAILGSMKPEDLAQGLIAVVLMLNALVKVASEFASFNNDLAKGAGALVLMAMAISLLSFSVKSLGNMDLGSLVKGMVGVIAMLNALTAVSKHLESIDPGTGASILLIAFGISILANAVTKLGAIPWPELLQGLIGVGTLLGSLAFALNKMPTEGVVKAGAAIVLMSVGISILADALTKISAINPDALGNSLLTVAASLSAFMLVANATADAGSGAAGIALMAAAMLPLAMALKMLSSIPLPALGVGLAGLAVSLLIFGAAAKILAPMAMELVIVAGAMALFGVAVAAVGVGIASIGVGIATGGMALIAFLKELILLAPSAGIALATMLSNFAKTLVQNSLEIAKSFVSLGEVILESIVKLAPKIATAFMSIMKTMGTAIIKTLPTLQATFVALWTSLLDTVVAIAPKLLTTVTTLLSMLASAVKAQSTIFLSTVLYVIQAIGKTVIAALPTLVSVISAGISALLTLVTTVAPQIFNTLLMLLTTFLQQLSTYVPTITALGMEIITGFLNAVAENIGAVVEAGINIIVNFINGISASIGLVIDAAFKLIISFINGLADAIDSNGASLMAAVMHLVTSLLNFIISAAGMLIPGASTLVATLVNGIIGFAGQMVAGASTLVGRIVSAIIGFAGRMVSGATTLVTRFVSSITGQAGRGSSAGSSLVSRVVSAVTSGASRMFSAGVNVVQGFINGISSRAGAVWSAAASVAQQAWNAVSSALKMHSPSRLLFEGGEYFVQGFVNGINSLAPKAAQTAGRMAMLTVDSFNDNIDTDYQPVISPVLDLSNIQNGIGSINKIFDATVPSLMIDGISSNQRLANELSNYASANTQNMSDLANELVGIIDYNQLGVSVANALVSSGLYVKVDGQQMIGYLAGETRNARRMYGYI